MVSDSSWAKHKMRENRNNQYRPEQIEFHKKLRDDRPENTILMEYTVKYTNEQGDNRIAIGDVVDVTRREFYRLNGAIHNSGVRENKDWEQKVYLELLGWSVFDIEIP